MRNAGVLVDRGTFRRFTTILAPALALAIGIVLLAATDLWQSYSDAGARGEETVRNLALVLAEQTERSFQSVDLMLQGVTDTLLKNTNIPDNDPEFGDALRQRIRALPYVQALLVVRPDGFLAHDTGYPKTPPVNVADRPYFKDHQQNPALGLLIGHPLRSRVDDKWLISFSRRIDRLDGSFGGVVVAAVDPSYFETFYHSLAIGEGGFVSLLLRDGTMLARSPASDHAIGKSFADTSAAFSYVASQPHGVYWSASPVDGVSRVVGYKTLTSAPALVLVGITYSNVFRPWHNHAALTVTAAAMLLFMLGALLYLVFRSRRREQEELARFNRGQRMEALGRIAGGIAHDFGNTIRIMQTTLRLLRPSFVEDREACALAADAEQVLRSAKDMTERLLAVARRQDLRPRPIVIDDRILAFSTILKQAAGPQVSVGFALASDAAACRLDPVQLEATLLNLVLNARDAMASGGRITVATEIVHAPQLPATSRLQSGPHLPWVRITVSDTGTGMPPGILEQVFEPFFTTKAPGQGSGLGLSQVLSFVQQSAGHVMIESEERRGTSVHLLFPALAQEDQASFGDVEQDTAQTSLREPPDARSGYS